MTLRWRKTLKIASLSFTSFLVLFAAVTYFFYRDLKGTFLLKLSHKTSAFIGQRVQIADISFGLGGEMNLHDIVINNPRGFERGQLLRVKKLSLGLRWKELAGGMLSFRTIGINSPELTLITGEKGIMNVSEELKRFLSKKGTTKYQIDEVRIRSGTVSLGASPLTAGRDIDLSVKNVSSGGDAKTLVGGALTYAGNAIQVEGWADLNSADKQFNVSLSADDFSFSPFRDALQAYKIDTEKVRASVRVNAEGGAVKGCRITSRVRLKEEGSFAIFKDKRDLRLESDAFYDYRESSFAVNDLSLYEGSASLMHLKGLVTDIGKHSSYVADVTIRKLDLSDFNVIKGTEIRGEVTSDGLRIKGNPDKMLSELSGAIKLRGGVVRSPDIDIERADAEVTFSTDTEIAIMSDIHLSSVSLKTHDGTSLLLDRLDSSVEGIFSRGALFNGRVNVGMKGIRFGDYKFPSLNGGLHVDYRKDLIAIRDLKIDSGEAKTSVGRIALKMDERQSAWSVEIKDLSALYPARELRLGNTDLIMRIRMDRKAVSGEIALSSGEITFQGIPARVTSGTVRFNANDFSLSFPLAEIAGGGAALSAKGKVSKGPFPFKLDIHAGGIDLGVLSGASQFNKLGYAASGTLEHAVLSGTMDSPESLQGQILVGTKNLSLVKKDTNKAIVKNAGLDAEIICKGRDCGFRTEMAAGSVRAGASGEVKRFAEKERVVTMKALLPETKLTDIRTALWDIFPDGLLYGGLDGYLSSDVAMEHSGNGMKATGSIRLANVLLKGENGEYSVGPINGTVPFQYDTARHAQNITGMPSFEPSEFAALSRYYSPEFVEHGYQKITINSLRYGFRILDAVDIRVKQGENSLNIGRITANMFGGRLNGSAVVDFSDGLMYRAGMLFEGISLTKLCEEIEPIKGYVSGKVDGTATVKGSGAGVSRLIGKADFRSYSSGGEETKVSREFLQKVGGPSLKAYLGDRSFDKGVMGLYLQNGFVIFRELEISHRNMVGVTDLSVKVAPFNNRIEINHLLWTVTEAAQRAGDKQ
jgi:hypothetical protein